MSRLIVVSNRVSAVADSSGGATGGLTMALSAALRESSGIWFGWSGETTDPFTGHLAVRKAAGVTVALIDLEEQDRQEYYNGYANRTLWPLFHYRTDLVAYERSFGAGYERVNERFARTLQPLIGPDDVIWVQDYHLLLLARELRRRGVKNPIGFFLHIPWPARRLLTTLPGHSDLVEAVLDFDLVGFQAQDHRDAFADYVRHVAGGTVEKDGETRAFGKVSRVGVFPIGIDAEDFGRAVGSEAAAETRAKMRESRGGRKMILGVDRLDYSKGLEERFLAYEQFLEDNPAAREEVFLLQIATATRGEVDAYRDLRGRLDTISGRVNGAFATIDWVPLRYVNRSYRRDELAGVYGAANIGLVTPLRDGMNLVAKEYVAAQDARDPGVLILSEFAGAATEMTDALIVNPLSREDVAEAIKQGLNMPLQERVRRWEALMHGVQTRDVGAWRDSFVARLIEATTAPAAAPAAAS